MSASSGWLRDPAAALREFFTVLGIAEQEWLSRETLTQLDYSTESMPRAAVASLQLVHLQALLDAYGEALECHFDLGDLPVLTLHPGLSEADLEAFRRDTAATPTLSCDLTLDKQRLVEVRLGSLPQTRLLLFFGTEVAQRLLAQLPGDLEAALWENEPGQRVVLLLPTQQIWLVGRSLALLGGPQIEGWAAALPALPPDVARLREIYDCCTDTVRWQEVWVRFLTPLHLRTEGQAAPHDPLVQALQTQLANLILIYTADRTMQRSDGLVVTYSGAQERAEVPLPRPDKPLTGTIQIEVLNRFFDWVYEPGRVVDRLLMVQVTTAQAVRDRPAADRYQWLVSSNTDGYYTEVQRQWKSFVEGKVDAYTAQVRALEDDVGTTVQLFADQIATMIKGLTDTMLAAVAALLASFIAALFQNPFNPTIFRIGMGVYAGYVLLFPLTYTMSYQWQRYRVLGQDFALRCAHFKKRLSAAQVDEIVGQRVSKSGQRFRVWFAWTVAIYLAVVVLAILALIFIPQAGIGTSHLPSPTLTATPTP